MTDLEHLTLDLPQLRIRARDASTEEVAAWSGEQRARVGCEIRWCIDALSELDARIRAVNQPLAVAATD